MTALDRYAALVAPFPADDDEASPDRLAKHYTVLAYMSGRIALTHPDPEVSGRAHRDVGLYYALAYLLQAVALNAPWVASVAAKQIRQELEDGTHIAVDVADWLKTYRITPESLDACVRDLVTKSVPADRPAAAAEVA